VRIICEFAGVPGLESPPHTVMQPNRAMGGAAGPARGGVLTIRGTGDTDYRWIRLFRLI